ncbi:hypothetical protein BK774_16375 [Bacillus thuringiensis]|uniref:Uncharacterized protein n=1 Tax=Bacillus thuringiensis TaxID=1428 RepID=A0A9X6Q2W4_BACTU|nr:hypothetical protein BK759_00430 [Bacillus thuringiensis serovar aizawai]OUA02114.1 hypothetical protein BK774_16375 [Bacillus thuringiensis]
MYKYLVTYLFFCVFFLHLERAIISGIGDCGSFSRFTFQIGVQPHAHQLKNLHYPQVSKNVILSKKLARKDDIFYESFNSR